MSSPVIGGDGESGEGLDVGLDVREEDVEPSHGDLEMEKEVGSLVVGDRGEGVAKGKKVVEDQG